MNKLQYLQMCKRFLLKIVKYRRQLLAEGAGKPATESMIEVMALIEYWVPQMNSFDRISKYIQRTKIQNGIREIIPSNKKKWSAKLDIFLVEAERLQQPATQQKLTYSY